MKKALALFFLINLTSTAYADKYEICWNHDADEATNIRVCKKLAEQGNPEAQSNLAYSYYTGQGVEQDHRKALELYKKAAAQKWSGMLSAQFNVAKIYSQGDDQLRDYELAMQWHLRAAEFGDEASQSSIGSMFLTGRGVKKDLVQAYKWFTIAKKNVGTVRLPELLTTQITQNQIAEGQQLADQWIAEHPCGIYSEECRKALLAK